MKNLIALVSILCLVACAGAPPLPAADDLFHDQAFAPAQVRPDPGAPLALSAAMRDYLAALPHKNPAQLNRREQLIDALRHGDLRLEYDATETRTAAETFDSRSGNCLALVLMTSAFARQMGLEVHYQAVIGDEPWDRADELYIAIGHVNLLVEEARDPAYASFSLAHSTVIDFLPPSDASRLVTRPIEERTVIAMFMNNRAIETLTQGQTDQAYWWAREALRQDPELSAAYVTLAVIYRKQGHAQWAGTTLDRIAARAPDDLNVMSNRVLVLRDLGRVAEADALAQRLARLDPEPPFAYFQQGMAALRAGHPELARRLFAKEIDRAPYHAEFEYWMAVSCIELRDPDHAARHLARAVEASTTRHDHDLYAAKLERLKALIGP